MDSVKRWKEFPDLDKELKQELEQMSEADLVEAFYKDLEFGTAGMRGIIGAGTNRMNIYTLRRANYGYGKYLLNKYSRPSVVIAYDTRHKSKEFAEECAKVLGEMQIKVFLFDKVTPTPELSFAVRYYKRKAALSLPQVTTLRILTVIKFMTNMVVVVSNWSRKLEEVKKPRYLRLQPGF